MATQLPNIGVTKEDNLAIKLKVADGTIQDPTIFLQALQAIQGKLAAAS